MKRLLIFAVLLSSVFTVCAQELSIRKMEVLYHDTYASVYKRIDESGSPCAMLRISLPLSEVTFSGNIVGNIERDGSDYLLYMSENSKHICLYHPICDSLNVIFSDYGIDGLQRLITYRLTVSMPHDNNNLSYFLLNVQPQNAHVAVDNKKILIDPSGEYTLLLSRDKHTLTLTAEGYESKNIPFTLEDARQSMQVALKPNMASLSITSKTQDADIIVNGKKQGSTAWYGVLNPGKYDIEISLDGYSSYKESVILTKGQQKIMAIPELIAKKGSIKVDYDPKDSEVWLDGEKIGFSYNIFNDILIGNHDVSIRKEGYTTKNHSITVTEGHITSVSGILIQAISSTAIEILNKGLEEYDNQNYTKAVEFFRKASEQGLAQAQFNLGLCYDKGLGVIKDISEAVNWYSKSAYQGFADAQFNMGNCYFNGHGVNKDIKKAIFWYEKAAQQGLAQAQFNLGLCFFNGIGVSRDYSQAVYWYEKAAEQNYGEAQHNLGSCYFEGIGLNKDFDRAKFWFQKAADQGVMESQYNLGLCYYNGVGVVKNDSQTVYWFTKSAEKGYAEAQNDLANCYTIGIGVEKDYSMAMFWYKKAAEQGIAQAQYNLGYYYSRGISVTQDYKQAVYWYKKAAEQGSADAQCNLGHCYLVGNGVTKDYTQAVSWFMKAAEQGHAVAQYNLGLCYQDGSGITKDITKAKYWYQKAAEQGNEAAIRELENL